MECEQCGQSFNPVATRWLCPHCKFKANCCDGAPQPPKRDLLPKVYKSPTS